MPKLPAIGNAKLKNAASKILERRGVAGISKLSCRSFNMSSKGSVKEFSSEQEMKDKMLEDNQARCSFFKYYQYDGNSKLGTGCSAHVYMC